MALVGKGQSTFLNRINFIINSQTQIEMETKQEIVDIVNTLPDEVLNDLLVYLRQVEKSTSQKMRLSLNLQTILSEDKEVLEKLAK